jgi:hypothetical protein
MCPGSLDRYSFDVKFTRYCTSDHKFAIHRMFRCACGEQEVYSYYATMKCRAEITLVAHVVSARRNPCAGVAVITISNSISRTQNVTLSVGDSQGIEISSILCV